MNPNFMIVYLKLTPESYSGNPALAGESGILLLNEAGFLPPACK